MKTWTFGTHTKPSKTDTACLHITHNNTFTYRTGEARPASEIHQEDGNEKGCHKQDAREQEGIWYIVERVAHPVHGPFHSGIQDSGLRNTGGLVHGFKGDVHHWWVAH